MRKEKERISSGRLWMGSIIAALVSAVAIYLVMLQMEKNVLSEYEKEIVYVAGCEIPKGQILDEGNWQNYVQQKEVDKSCIPATAIPRKAAMSSSLLDGQNISFKRYET